MSYNWTKKKTDPNGFDDINSQKINQSDNLGMKKHNAPQNLTDAQSHSGSQAKMTSLFSNAKTILRNEELRINSNPSKSLYPKAIMESNPNCKNLDNPVGSVHSNQSVVSIQSVHSPNSANSTNPEKILESRSRNRALQNMLIRIQQRDQNVDENETNGYDTINNLNNGFNPTGGNQVSNFPNQIYNHSPVTGYSSQNPQQNQFSFNNSVSKTNMNSVSGKSFMNSNNETAQNQASRMLKYRTFQKMVNNQTQSEFNNEIIRNPLNNSISSPDNYSTKKSDAFSSGVPSNSGTAQHSYTYPQPPAPKLPPERIEKNFGNDSGISIRAIKGVNPRDITRKNPISDTITQQFNENMGIRTGFRKPSSNHEKPIQKQGFFQKQNNNQQNLNQQNLNQQNLNQSQRKNTLTYFSNNSIHHEMDSSYRAAPVQKINSQTVQSEKIPDASYQTQQFPKAPQWNPSTRSQFGSNSEGTRFQNQKMTSFENRNRNDFKHRMENRHGDGEQQYSKYGTQFNHSSASMINENLPNSTTINYVESFENQFNPQFQKPRVGFNSNDGITSYSRFTSPSGRENSVHEWPENYGYEQSQQASPYPQAMTSNVSSFQRPIFGQYRNNLSQIQDPNLNLNHMDSNNGPNLRNNPNHPISMGDKTDYNDNNSNVHNLQKAEINIPDFSNNTKFRDAEILEKLHFLENTEPVKCNILSILMDGEEHPDYELLRQIKKTRYMGSVALGVILYNLIDLFGSDMIIRTNVNGTKYYQISSKFLSLCKLSFEKDDNIEDPEDAQPTGTLF